MVVLNSPFNYKMYIDLMQNCLTKLMFHFIPNRLRFKLLAEHFLLQENQNLELNYAMKLYPYFIIPD